MLQPFRIEKVDFGFCTSAPSHFGQMQDLPGYQALQGLLRLYLLLHEKKQTSCLKGGYKLSYVFLLLSHNARSTHTHTQQSSALQFWPHSNSYFVHTYTLVPFSFINSFWINVLFSSSFSVFFSPSHLAAAHNAKSSRNLFTILLLTACHTSSLRWEKKIGYLNWWLNRQFFFPTSTARISGDSCQTGNTYSEKPNFFCIKKKPLQRCQNDKDTNYYNINV